MPQRKPVTVAEIDDLQSRLRAMFDAAVAEARSEHPSLPEGVHRQLLTRGDDCMCRLIRGLLAKQEEPADG